ncbi:aminoglycoside phosphotransferase family protein [Streptosporangium saharense]
MPSDGDLLARLLPDAPEDLVVHEGQFHRVVVGADRVVCLPRTRAAASRLPRRAETLRLLAELNLGFATPVPLLEHGAGWSSPERGVRDTDGQPLPEHGIQDVGGRPLLEPGSGGVGGRLLSERGVWDVGGEPLPGPVVQSAGGRPLPEHGVGDVGWRSLLGPGTRSVGGRSSRGHDELGGWSWLVLSRVPGEPLVGDVLADPGVAEAVAAQYVMLLAALRGAGADERARAVPAEPRDRWRRFAQDVRNELFWLMSEEGRRRAERELAALDDLPHLTDALVHGDLGAENVLWETVGGLPRLGGVVDWDEVTIGDQAEDLAAIGAGHGAALLRRVLALGGWSGDTAARVTVIGRTFALQQALSAFRDEDEEELADGLSGYR